MQRSPGHSAGEATWRGTDMPQPPAPAAQHKSEATPPAERGPTSEPGRQGSNVSQRVPPACKITRHKTALPATEVWGSLLPGNW